MELPVTLGSDKCFSALVVQTFLLFCKTHNWDFIYVAKHVYTNKYLMNK